MRLHGYIAIEFAAVNDLPLNKYTDPMEDSREGLTVAEAKAVASEDPDLIWLESPLLVLDAITDANTTADEAVILLFPDCDRSAPTTIRDAELIRALYDDETAQSYGDGSYMVGAHDRTEGHDPDAAGFTIPVGH